MVLDGPTEYRFITAYLETKTFLKIKVSDEKQSDKGFELVMMRAALRRNDVVQGYFSFHGYPKTNEDGFCNFVSWSDKEDDTRDLPPHCRNFEPTAREEVLTHFYRISMPESHRSPVVLVLVPHHSLKSKPRTIHQLF
ncbi:hypothetical protein AVEN_103010-1 [Araneus ventricosus]|uniref:Uncharacterized protein n=1 Tax=Araneus ventricosus TaxID=182803 RepID=A0A4Y2BAP8_ARAVE|nr:hypothetical protein AVEN_103010-1 [Araneus ventricosus]